MKLCVAILAAGQGTRMRSEASKVLHPVAGEPMICHVVNRARELKADPIVVVVGYQRDKVRDTLGPGLEYVEQERQLGTGHALVQARPKLEGRAETVLVLYGDVPLVTKETLRNLIRCHQESKAVLTVLTTVVDNPTGYGRILRDVSGKISGIVEEIAATPDQKAIKEINTGLYCFDDRWLWSRLDRIQPDPRSGEYYLPALVAMAVQEGRPIESALAEDPDEVMGVNNRVQLAEAEAALRSRICHAVMLSGVTMTDPRSTFVDQKASVGQDTVIYPNTHILGRTIVGRQCIIGPNTVLQNATVGDRCRIVASFVEDSILDEGCQVGPYVHLRPGTHLKRQAQVMGLADRGWRTSSYSGGRRDRKPVETSDR